MANILQASAKLFTVVEKMVCSINLTRCFSQRALRIYSDAVGQHSHYICRQHYHWLQCQASRYSVHKLNMLQSCWTIQVRNSTSNLDSFTLQNELFKAYLENLEAEYNNMSFENDSSEQRMAVLRRIVDQLNAVRGKYEELKELEEMGKDESFQSMVVEEKETCLQAIQELEGSIVEMLLPADKYDDRDVILEVECGAGGMESMMFAYELLTMYQNYAAYKGWRCEVNSMDHDRSPGKQDRMIRKASVSICGTGVYGRLKFEGGVHRVKRNPVTDPGRIHTSTVSVAVLFQPTKIDLHIDEKKDLKIEVKGAGGPGGQHVQKSETFVRIKHLPTGLVAECQHSRLQHKNKELALQQLKARLMDVELKKVQSKTVQQRKIQVGGKGRSERIRTYQYSIDSVVEHRLGRQFRNIENFLTGEEAFDMVIDELQKEDKFESLQIRLEEFEKVKVEGKTGSK